MKSKFCRLLTIGLVLNLLLIVGIYLWTRSPKGFLPKITPLTSLKSICYSEVKNGFKKWELKAAQVGMAKTKKTILKDIKATFFSEGNLPIYLKADNGVLDLEAKEMVLKGRVCVWQEGGYTFTTTSLNYNDTQHLLFTDAHVKVKGNNLWLTAQGMRYFVKEKRLILCQKVKTTVSDIKDEDS
jgi:LPS export ABC transporter protein LptC